ncbi:chemotaxis-specific protein-glutamate methyltransferase CheB [Methanogenium organophilum]|uniref:Protein-glutamate methylesterase/protein-glutamine glutaminase n=1 Tax=Methanogenium organophilum TaxID=2199 RepID=A0A9X9S3F0_METOG|nr:chemotaxis-specific protein-glutamate methyltransferase CheB [Methanogenium organophilum]WAI01037.1 chemotaxis-specific protein-glutamate methyltransferase CheB [Methanogenium organophilum]
MLRVLIVDDSVFIRTVLSDLLNRDPEIEVIGTACNGVEALPMIEELKPDILTLDMQMPQMDGIETLKQISHQSYRPKILVLSTLTSRDADLTYTALRLGADDFMLKPRNISKVRGIENELTTKLKQIISISEPQKCTPKSDIPAENLIVIGSSAGGPSMLDQILSNLKGDQNAAFIITQHMPEGFTAALAERLNRICPMPVKETESGDILNNGNVYLSKGGYHTVISRHIDEYGHQGGQITLTKSAPVHAVRPAVDITFSSAAKVFGKNCLSVILSGMGNDAGEGALAIKKAGGSTFAVREEDCLVYGMVRSALKRDCIDKVIPLNRIHREIMQYIAKKE